MVRVRSAAALERESGTTYFRTFTIVGDSGSSDQGGETKTTFLARIFFPSETGARPILVKDAESGRVVQDHEFPEALLHFATIDDLHTCVHILRTLALPSAEDANNIQRSIEQFKYCTHHKRLHVLDAFANPTRQTCIAAGKIRKRMATWITTQKEEQAARSAYGLLSGVEVITKEDAGKMLRMINPKSDADNVVANGNGSSSSSLTGPQRAQS